MIGGDFTGLQIKRPVKVNPAQMFAAIPTLADISKEVINISPVGALIPTLQGQAFALQQVYPPIGEYRKAPQAPKGANVWQRIQALLQHPQMSPTLASNVLGIVTKAFQARRDPSALIDLAKLVDSQIKTYAQLYQSAMTPEEKAAILGGLSRLSAMRDRLFGAMLGGVLPQANVNVGALPYGGQ